MPSLPHETLLQLFRNCPALAARLLREASHEKAPKFTAARLDSADFIQLQPTEYRADVVVLLQRKKPVMGIIVEAQLRADTTKHYAWPVDVATLQTRLKCPVALRVVALRKPVAHWAAKPLPVGTTGSFTPWCSSPQ